MQLSEFQDKMREFVAHLDVQRGLSRNTYRSYELDLQQFAQYWQELLGQNNHSLAIHSALEQFWVHLYRKNISKSSIARKVSCLKSFQKFCLSRGITLELSLQRPRLDKRLPVYLSIDEMFHLLDDIKQNDLPTYHPLRDMAILELLYATGIRCAELTNIRMRDVNFADKTIRIKGKGSQERIALFGNKAQAKLVSYLDSEREAVKETDEFLFINNRGQKISSRAVQRTLEEFRVFLKIKRPITPHKIRHTFATHLLNQGVDLRLVQELLGHKSLSSTQMYTHVTMQRLSEICDRLHPINNVTGNDTEHGI